LGARLAVVVVLGGLLLALAVLAWRENERRYGWFALTGCFGEGGVAVQDCTGARRLCRDAPPLIDWRSYCR